VNADARLPNPLASLRRFAQKREVKERCELCSLELPGEHPHLIELASRRLCCACEACAVLFSDAAAARYRRVPRESHHLADFRMTDVQWAGLNLPIDLAFFMHSTPAGRVVAFYPSPAGATEAAADAEVWQLLAEENPVLRELQPDVEALLVNRLGEAPEYYRVGIDQCYRLVGLIRTHWRGMSGGTEVWGELARFFASLKERSA
jgi:hypothetical protein